MGEGEPLLLICHSFPPVSGIGGRRWAKFAKELARRGHPVHVIRSAVCAKEGPSAWVKDVAHPGIIAHPLPRRYPNAMVHWPATSAWEKVQYAFWLRALPCFTKGNWYDRGLFWRGPLLRTASKLIRAHNIRNVIVTGAPFRLLAYATELKQSFPEINLVADFRDGWTQSTYYGYQSIGPRRLAHEKALEGLVARTCDMLTSPHLSVIEHLQQAYHVPDARVALLGHAIDPDDMPTKKGRRDDTRFRMIYAGSLPSSSETDVYFSHLLLAFRKLKNDRPGVFENSILDMYITGHGTGQWEQEVLRQGLDGKIRFHAPLPAKEALQEIADADLVIAHIPSVDRDIIGTKFNEIAYLGTPILHVGLPGKMASTIQGQRMGDSVRVEELADELPRILCGERKVNASTGDLNAFLLAPLTDQLIRNVLR